MPVSGQNPTRVHLVSNDEVTWAAGSPYTDPNDPNYQVRDVEASTPDFTGDSGSGGAKGAVPAPAAGDAAAGKFLKADGTWDTPSGGAGSGTVTHTGGALTDHLVVVGNGADDVEVIASVGTAGQYLRSGGAGVDPAFASIAESEVANLVSDLAAKLDDSQLDIDPTFAANSDALIPSQKAVKSALAAVAPGGSGALTVKTNGVTNGSQALLDLLNGLGITLTDDGVGHVTARAKSYTLDVQSPTGTLTGNSADQTVFTTTIPAAALVVGSMVRVTLVYEKLTGAVATTSKLFVGGTALAIDSAFSTNAKAIYQFNMVVTGSSAQTLAGQGIRSNVPLGTLFANPAEAISGAIIVKCTINVASPTTFKGHMWLVEVLNP